MPAIKIDSNMSAVAYHIVDGAQDFPYAVDAQSAVGRHPLEWSMQPWTAEASDAARKQLSDRYDREAALAKSRGLPPPVKPAWLDAEPVQPTPEEQAAIDDHAKAVAEANERLKAFRAKQAEDKKVADQVSADEALVASPPPRPDPAARRPLTPAQIRKRSAETDEERLAREQSEAAANAKKAADDKLVKDKADADKIAAVSTPVPTPVAAAPAK